MSKASEPSQRLVTVNTEGVMFGPCFISHEAILKERGPIVRMNYKEWLDSALSQEEKPTSSTGNNIEKVNQEIMNELKLLASYFDDRSEIVLHKNDVRELIEWVRAEAQVKK